MKSAGSQTDFRFIADQRAVACSETICCGLVLWRCTIETGDFIERDISTHLPSAFGTQYARSPFRIWMTITEIAPSPTKEKRKQTTKTNGSSSNHFDRYNHWLFLEEYLSWHLWHIQTKKCPSCSNNWLYEKSSPVHGNFLAPFVDENSTKCYQEWEIRCQRKNFPGGHPFKEGSRKVRTDNPPYSCTPPAKGLQSTWNGLWLRIPSLEKTANYIGVILAQVDISTICVWSSVVDSPIYSCYPEVDYPTTLTGCCLAVPSPLR